MEQRLKKCVSPVDVKIETLNRKEVSVLSFFREYSLYLSRVTFVFVRVEQSHIKVAWYFYSLEKDIM